MNEEVNIDSGQMIYYSESYVSPFSNPETVFEDAVGELKKEILKSKARLDKPYKIKLEVEEL